MGNNIHLHRIAQLLASTVQEVPQNVCVGIMMIHKQDAHALNLSLNHSQGSPSPQHTPETSKPTSAASVLGTLVPRLRLRCAPTLLGKATVWLPR